MSVDWKKTWEDMYGFAKEKVKDGVAYVGEKIEEFGKGVSDTFGTPIESPYETGSVKNLTYTPYGETDAGIKDKTAWDKAIETYNQNVSPFQYANDEAYKAALEALTGREKFTYDLNSDALYQQYAKQYSDLGKLAAEDVMGQASMLTGGYGNSYAATAGNQAYQSYLNQLNNIVPELYNSALNAYNAEGQRLADNVDMYMQDYSKAYTDWANNESYYKGLVDDAEATYRNNAKDYMTEADISNAATSANNENAWKDATWKETNRQQAKAEKDQAAQDAYNAYLDTLDLYSEFNADKLRENQEIHYREKGVTSFYEDAVSALDEIKANATSAEDYVDNVIDYIDDMYNKSFISPEEKEKLGKYLARGTGGSPYPTVVQDLTILLYDKYGPNGAGKQAKINELLGKLRDAGILSKEQYDRWSKPL